MEPVKIHLTAVNSQLTCVLCSGYLIDATTIVECLHSFCRSCLLRYLESNNFCPICDVQVYKSKPHLNIRSDTILQSLVYKMIPSLYQREMSKRRTFYENHPEIDCSLLDSESRGDYPGKRDIFSPDDSISLSVCYSQSGLPVDDGDLKELEDLTLPTSRRYLNCPAAVTISHLKKFIRMKYALSEAQYKIDFFYEGIIIPEDHTLMDVAYVYNWTREEPMKFFYRISEKIQKCVKRRKTVPAPRVVEPDDGGRLARKITLLFNLSLAHDPKHEGSKGTRPPPGDQTPTRKKSGHKKDRKREKRKSGNRHRKKRFVAEACTQGDTSITLKLKASPSEGAPLVTPPDPQPGPLEKAPSPPEAMSSDDVNSETDPGAMTIDEAAPEACRTPTPPQNDVPPPGPTKVVKSTQSEALDLSQYSSRPVLESPSSSNSSSPIPTSPQQPPSPKPRAGRGQSTQTILSIAESLLIKQKLQQKFQQTIGANGIVKESAGPAPERPAVAGPCTSAVTITKTKISITDPLTIHAKKPCEPSPFGKNSRSRLSDTRGGATPTVSKSSDNRSGVASTVARSSESLAGVAPTMSRSSDSRTGVAPTMSRSSDSRTGVPSIISKSSDSRTGVAPTISRFLEQTVKGTPPHKTDYGPQSGPSPRLSDFRSKGASTAPRIIDSRPQTSSPISKSNDFRPRGISMFTSVSQTVSKTPLTLKIPRLPSHMSLEPSSPTNKGANGVHSKNDVSEPPNISILPITKSPLKMPVCNKIQRSLKDDKSRPGDSIGRSPVPVPRIPRSPNQSVRTIPNPSLLRQQSQGRIQNCGSLYSGEASKFHDIEKLMRAIHHMDEPTVFCVPK